jgi:tRNA threonylcarbamoyladenosine biosynthesis protein TsaB
MVAEETRTMQRLHNEAILEVVDEVIASACGSAADRRRIDAVGFGCGPGSFTGVRIAAAVAQAIAFGSNARIVPVSGTYALAVAGLEHAPTGRDPEGIVVAIPSRRDAWYVAGFRVIDGRLQAAFADALWQGPEPWSELGRAGTASGWWLVGGGPPEHATLCPDLHEQAGIATSGATIARLAAIEFEAGRSLAPAAGLPVYVEGDSPWRPA